MLTLTGGTASAQDLTLEITANGQDDASVSDSFTLSLIEGSEPAPEPMPTPEPTATSTPEPTATATPDPAPTLITEFDDLSVAHGGTSDLDMSDHFAEQDLSYSVLVTTTNQRTGQVKTGPLNEIARNKVTGEWNDDVLTLAGGTAAPQDLTLEITATGIGGASVSDSFTFTLTDGSELPPRANGNARARAHGKPDTGADTNRDARSLARLEDRVRGRNPLPHRDGNPRHGHPLQRQQPNLRSASNHHQPTNRPTTHRQAERNRAQQSNRHLAIPNPNPPNNRHQPPRRSERELQLYVG